MVASKSTLSSFSSLHLSSPPRCCSHLLLPRIQHRSTQHNGTPPLPFLTPLPLLIPPTCPPPPLLIITPLPPRSPSPLHCQNLSLHQITAVLLIDNDSNRILAKYYQPAHSDPKNPSTHKNPFQSLKEQRAFEATVWEKTRKQTGSSFPPCFPDSQRDPTRVKADSEVVGKSLSSCHPVRLLSSISDHSGPSRLTEN